MKAKHFGSALALILGASLLLTGCGGQTEAQTESTPMLSETTKTAPTTEPARESIVLPSCSAMNSTAQQEYEDFGVEMFAEPSGETDFTTFNEITGPVAQDAMAKAVQQRGCRWPLHSEGTVTEHVAELPEAAQAPLIEALRNDPGITESTLGNAVSFSYESPASNGYMSATEITYLFLGDIWISVFDYAGQKEYAKAALDGVLAVNPVLADTGTRDTPSDAAGECSSSKGLEVLSEWAPTVQGGPWDTTGQLSDVSGYDECAALSWIVLRPEQCCTRFSITPVLFFHNGENVRSAAVIGNAMDSENGIQRVSDGELSVTYMWPGDDIAGPANTANSTYRWDEKSSTVIRTGELPPN